MKKYIILGLMVLTIGVGGMVALAEDSVTTTTTPPIIAVPDKDGPMIVNIGPKGNVLLRGKIVSISTDSFVVKSWGGSWTVQVGTTTKYMSKNKVLSDLKEGEMVGVQGDISQDGDFVIVAKIVRAWGPRADSDKDGIPDNQDGDDDNDGIDNMHDKKHMDYDNDGILDSVDTDDDNDGILDTVDTQPLDMNNDGIPDRKDRREGRMPRMMDDNRGPGRNGENRGPGGGDDN